MKDKERVLVTIGVKEKSVSMTMVVLTGVVIIVVVDVAEGVRSIEDGEVWTNRGAVREIVDGDVTDLVLELKYEAAWIAVTWIAKVVAMTDIDVGLWSDTDVDIVFWYDRKPVLLVIVGVFAISRDIMELLVDPAQKGFDSVFSGFMFLDCQSESGFHTS